MRLDNKNQDILIHIAANRRSEGIWSFESFARMGRTVRQAGKIGSGAHDHSLLSLAVINGLRSFSKRQREAFALKAGVPKARVLIVSRDADFVASMSSKGKQPSHAGKNFSSFLAKTIYSYSVSWHLETDEDGFAVPQLAGWGEQSLKTPSDYGMPSHLQQQAVLSVA